MVIQKSKNFIKKIPNYLTLMRVFLIPVFIVAYYLPWSFSNILATSIFAIACITDLIDGYLARKLNVCSKFGAFLDPVADKIMVCVALILIVGSFSDVGSIVKELSVISADGNSYIYEYSPIWATIVKYLLICCSVVIISREIVVSALREWMAEIGNRTKVAVSWIGKWKTTLQMLAIGGFIWKDNSLSWWNNWMIDASLLLMIIATVLTIWSMVNYLKAGITYMEDEI